MAITYVIKFEVVPEQTQPLPGPSYWRAGRHA